MVHMDKGRGPRRADQLLDEARGLSQLSAAARASGRLCASLQRALPADLRPHLRGAHLRDATLVLLVDGPEWAVRLRFLEPELKAALDLRTRRAVARCAVRVLLPDGTRKPAPRRGPRPLTDAARAALEAGSARVADPQLAAALKRLARRR
jgi:hypothetical protein